MRRKHIGRRWKIASGGWGALSARIGGAAAEERCILRAERLYREFTGGFPTIQLWEGHLKYQARQWRFSGRDRQTMRLSVLASGSKGNAIFIEMDGTRLLLDVGIGLRRLKEGLASLGVTLDTLDGVFLTHEHRDHVAGLAALLREVPLPVYSRPGTIAALPRHDLLQLPDRKSVV